MIVSLLAAAVIAASGCKMGYRDLGYGESLDLSDPMPSALGGGGGPPRRNAVPNWGRSYPMASVYGSEQEIARVDLPVPRDMTIMLGDIASMFLIGTHALPVVTIQYGTGGTANQTQIASTVRGSIYHVIAQSVVVRAFIAQSEATPASNARFQAMVGLGRPSTQTITHRVDVPAMGAGVDTDVRLLPWVNRISIRPDYTVTPATQPEIRWLAITEGGATSAVNNLDISDFAAPVWIPYGSTNGIRIVNNDANGFQAYVTQYWEL